MVFLVLVAGLLAGAASWAICPWLGGTFEPFDSGLSLAVGQAIMAVLAGYLGFRHGFGKAVVAAFGMYLGQIGYAYLLGGSETRGWILLGAVTTLFLCVAPVLAGGVGALARGVSKRKATGTG